MKENRRSLHCATPDFLLILVALANFMRLSLLKAAHAVVSSAAWQEIRVRSSRDDKFVTKLTTILHGKRVIAYQQICHLDRRSHGLVDHPR
jgi:hypothetical protein